LVVLGDLNDEPEAATTQILLGPPGSEIGTAGFERPDQGDGSRLWNLAPLIPEERRFSRVFRGRGELIDHLLVSDTLVRRVEQVDTGPGEPPSITEDPTDRRDEPASDHLPVVARFRVAENPPPPLGEVFQGGESLVVDAARAPDDVVHRRQAPARRG
jgi:endonuclease/exonuclease/phosphatase family metal-dependent hydrolase